jgi:hypothetical protein
MVTGAEELDLDNASAQDGAEAVAAAVSAEVAELSAQIEEQGSQIEALADEVKELDETAEEVLENVEGLEGMMQSGNFSSIGFANIFNRTNRLNQKLVGRSHGSRLGAESISDATTAQMMARSGIEGFMEDVKNWGKKAIEYIKHIFNTVIAFVVGLFSAASGIQRQAESLEKRIDAGKVKEKIKLGSWNAYFDYEKNGLTNGVLADTVKGFTTNVGALLDHVKSAQSVDVSAFSSAYSKVVDGVKSYFIGGSSKSAAQEGKDVVIGQHAGIRTMVSWKDGALKDDKDCVEAARALKMVIGKDSEASKKLSTGEAKAKLSATELKSVLTGVKAAAHALRENNSTKKFSAAQRDQVIGMLNAVKATDGEKKENVNKAIDVVKATYGASIALYSVGMRHKTAEARAALAGVSAHLGIGGSFESDKK